MPRNCGIFSLNLYLTLLFYHPNNFNNKTNLTSYNYCKLIPKKHFTLFAYIVTRKTKNKSLATKNPNISLNIC